MSDIFLFIDTETTGFKKKGPLIQPGQVRMCQLALILADDDSKIIAKISTLIKPEGWEISEGAFKAHGITLDHCHRFGMNSRAVFNVYAKMASMADQIIAHNAEFDGGIMEVEQAYFNAPLPNGTVRDADPLIVNKPWHCTMKTNTHITADGKWPKLDFALNHFCGRNLGDKAHNAYYDAEACMDIFFACRRLRA